MKVSWILCGVVVDLLGLSLVFPAIAQAQAPGGLQGLSLLLLGLGVVLSLTGTYIAVQGFRFQEPPKR